MEFSLSYSMLSPSDPLGQRQADQPGDKTGTDHHEEVRGPPKNFAVLKIMKGLVIETRIGGESPHDAGREHDTRRGGEQLRRQTEVHQDADQEGTDHVDRQRPIRERTSEGGERPAGNQITGAGPNGAPETDEEEFIHSCMCVTGELKSASNRRRRQESSRYSGSEGFCVIS